MNRQISGLPRYCKQRTTGQHSKIWLRFLHPILKQEVWRSTEIPVTDFNTAQRVSDALRVLLTDQSWHDWSTYVIAYGKFEKVAVKAFYKLSREHPRYKEAARYTEVHDTGAVVYPTPDGQRRITTEAEALILHRDETADLALKLDQERGQLEIWRDRALAAEARVAELEADKGLTTIPDWDELAKEYIQHLTDSGYNETHIRTRVRHLQDHEARYQNYVVDCERNKHTAPLSFEQWLAKKQTQP